MDASRWFVWFVGTCGFGGLVRFVPWRVVNECSAVVSCQVFPEPMCLAGDGELGFSGTPLQRQGLIERPDAVAATFVEAFGGWSADSVDDLVTGCQSLFFGVGE